MIMQTVDLYDDLEFTKLAEDEIRIFTDKEELPADQGNLIWRAAARMKELYQISEGVSVKLTKRIPIAAGMAGGSADAAATIHAMDALFCLGLSLEEKQKIGVKLGADIPYCLMGGTALSEGIGEILTRLPDVPKAKLVIAKPYPVIEQMKGILKEHGAVNALMSGSGPTVFGIFTDDQNAKEAYEAMQEAGLARQLFLTGFADGRGREE